MTASPLPGPSGNVEYFVWFRRGAPALDDADLRRAIESGPQLSGWRTPFRVTDLEARTGNA